MSNWHVTEVPVQDTIKDAVSTRDYRPFALCALRSGDGKVGIFQHADGSDLYVPGFTLDDAITTQQQISDYLSFVLSHNFVSGNNDMEVSFLSAMKHYKLERDKIRGTYRRGYLLLPFGIQYSALSDELVSHEEGNGTGHKLSWIEPHEARPVMLANFTQNHSSSWRTLCGLTTIRLQAGDSISKAVHIREEAAPDTAIAETPITIS